MGLLSQTAVNGRNLPQTAANCRTASRLSQTAASRRDLPQIAAAGRNTCLHASRTAFLIPLLFGRASLPDNWIPETRSRLSQRRARKPDTKAGQLWALWPEIKAALDEGQSVRTVLHWLKEDADIVVSIGTLTSYVSRNRKREAAQRTAEAAKAFIRLHQNADVATSHSTVGSAVQDAATPVNGSAYETETDPVERTMRALRKRRFDIREAHQNGDPTKVKLI
jgi:hypothetical protein